MYVCMCYVYTYMKINAFNTWNGAIIIDWFHEISIKIFLRKPMCVKVNTHDPSSIFSKICKPPGRLQFYDS